MDLKVPKPRVHLRLLSYLTIAFQTKDKSFYGIDASVSKTPKEKSATIREAQIYIGSQSEQFKVSNYEG